MQQVPTVTFLLDFINTHVTYAFEGTCKHTFTMGQYYQTVSHLLRIKGLGSANLHFETLGEKKMYYISKNFQSISHL